VFTIQSSASGFEGAVPGLTIGRRQRTRPEQGREPARDAASLRLRVVNSTENMTKDPERSGVLFPYPAVSKIYTNMFKISTRLIIKYDKL
jgi:hypothetical protein